MFCLILFSSFTVLHPPFTNHTYPWKLHRCFASICYHQLWQHASILIYSYHLRPFLLNTVWTKYEFKTTVLDKKNYSPFHLRDNPSNLCKAIAGNVTANEPCPHYTIHPGQKEILQQEWNHIRSFWPFCHHKTTLNCTRKIRIRAVDSCFRLKSTKK